MNRSEAEELLPWFVAGTLDEQEMQAVKAFIDSGEIDTAELAELAFLNESVAVAGAEEPAYNPQLLQRAMSQLDGVTQAPPSDFLDRLSNPDSSSEPDAESAPKGMFASMLERLQWSLTPPLARVAIAAQFALVLGLVVALTLGGQKGGEREEEAGFEVVSGAVAGDFTAAFAATAAEPEIRALLIENGVSIVAGPSALGMYTLDAADDVDEAAVLAALQASAITTFVQPVPDP
ncbi:MAG: hypothetical protein OES38_15115 [Gammaproteobacteria bacterium]|nr:hypothetical protein [Gammaproteobacteria bacterium]